ncbi:steroid 17-alpha-hydroxylase/17,20 lyase-like isoform X2 [Acanthaster planci]|uniref:Steroid 17-alpha-hydroxylase/17,20 lyase-like isoform X2 n=1 Tax=Acanthaster planci TaxID=133434 RepID=A0A8B7XPE0_ACAPL|nr:steroid 17-alpha-hydroxylase/17,20 lyase-like isoform X2 [Acanthaster planci]
MEVNGDVYLNVTTLLVAVGTLIAYALYKSIKRPAGFPPGPPALPFVGNIPQFYFANTTQQGVFNELWQKYGAVYSLKFASGDVVVLNTIDVVKEALVKKAVVFAGRPETYSLGLFTDGFKDIVFSTYGPQWRYQRKLGHTAIRHFAQKERLEQLVFSVTPGIAKTLDEMGDKPFAPKWTIGRIVYNVLATLCFAKTYEFNDPHLLNWIDLNTEITKAFGSGLPGDFMTIFQYIPTPGDTKFRRLLKRLRQTYREEFQRHRQTFDPENIRDFVDSLLLTQKENIEAGEEGADRLTDTHLVQTVSDIFGAGTETTILTLHWAVLLIAEYPEIQEKVAMEIDEVIGHDRMPSLTDRGSVPFTEATLLEIFRFGTVAPVGVLHSVMEDTTLCGYKLPKDTTVMINHMALHFSPAEWEEPDKFKPERFLNEDGQLPAKLPESLIPFGIGRRVCLGEDFAKKEVFLLFTWLCSRYTFYKVPGKEEETVLRLNKELALAHQLYDDIEVCVKKRF